MAGREITRCRFDDGAVRNWAILNKANKAQIAKDCSEQFYTDLRWSMSAWLLQQRFDSHGKTSLGCLNRRFAIPQVFARRTLYQK
jgi:hypothetical protein